MSLLLFSNIILFGIGCVLLIVKSKYVVIYYLIWAISAAYFYDIFFERLPQDDFGTFDKYANIYIYIAASIILLKKRKTISRDLKVLFYFFTFFLSLIFVISAIRGCFGEFVPLILQYFAWIPLCFVLYLEDIRFKDYEGFSKFLILGQTFLVIVQYMEIGVASFQQNFNTEFYSSCGTYFRYNFLASSFASILLFLLMSKLTIGFFKKIDYVIFGAGGLCIFLSGARTELMIFVFSLIVIFYYRFSNHKVAIVIISFIALMIVSGYVSGYEAGAEHGVDIEDRNSNIFAVLNGDIDYLTEGSTFGITFTSLLFFLEDSSKWLFGIGTFFSSSVGYGYLTPETKTDATLMFYISETGFVGLFFLMFFLFYIARLNKELRKWKYLFLFMLLFCTVTDMGVFHVMDTAFFLLFCRYTDLKIYKYECNHSKQVLPKKALA